MSQLATSIESLQVEPGKLGIFWLGGAAFTFKTAAGRIIYVDPYLSDALDQFYSWKRLPGSPKLVTAGEAKADLVLITHSHEDHLDPLTLPEMAKASEAIFAGPESCVATMRQWIFPAERVVQIDEGEQKSLAGIEVRAVFAHHVSTAGAQTPDAVGFLMDLAGVRVYHTGDTLYHPDLAKTRLLQPDVMLVCINGGYGNMNPAEAARLTLEIEPAVVIPMHWGLVAENTSDPADFIAELTRLGSRARPVVMSPGDLFLSTFQKLDETHTKGKAA